MFSFFSQSYQRRTWFLDPRLKQKRCKEMGLHFRTHRKVEVVEKTQEKTGKLTDARIHSDTYTIKIMRIGQRPELKKGS